MIEDRLLSLIKNEQQEITQGMIDFPVEDLKKYYLSVGRIHGLGKAIELLTGLLSDEDDNQ